MESCLLCLEINKDILDCIELGTKRWNDLNVANIIEKHFWALINIQIDSWICLPCWRELENFHKFYSRIEEAHVNFCRINQKYLSESLEYKKESTSDNEETTMEEKKVFCISGPGILADQLQQPDLIEPEIILDHNTELDMQTEKKIRISYSSDDLDDIPLKQALESKDPLEKTKKCRKRKEQKLPENDKVDINIVKEQPMDLNEVNMNEVNDDMNSMNDIDVSGTTYKDETGYSEPENKKNRISRKDNDKFIAEHLKEKMLCDLCQAPFQEFITMQKHFTKIHKQRGYFVCCERKFFDRSRLVDHIYRHLNPDHFKCKECGKAMSDRRSFDNHMLQVHRSNEVVKKHSCDICGKSFKKAYVLRMHKSTHLTEDEKKYPCADCGKNYATPYLLNQHTQAVHLKRFVKICYICGKAINSSAEFKIHMDKHEGIPLPDFDCDVCGLRLTSERGLKRHKESQHPIGGKQDHQCYICDKVSPTLTALQKHINTMHKKGYDHKCYICEKAFKRSEHLREHMATHTDTTLYTCEWCPKTYNSSGNMHAHRKNMHPKEWQESKSQKYSSNYRTSKLGL